MNYDAWKLFVEATELGSLSKVALAHGTTQPHISRQIADLEARCGGRLFQRTGRGVTLTELGKRVEPRVRAWLANTDQLVNDIHNAAGRPIGVVRIGILPSTAHPLVSTLYYRLRERYPLVQLNVREGQGAQLETWLEEGSVDLAILYRHSPVPKHGDVYLVETDTYLVGAEGDALTSHASVKFAQLDRLPLVMFCKPNSWWSRLEQLAGEHGIALNVVAQADSLTLQMHIAAEGGIYALLGPYAAATGAKAFRLQAAKIVEPAIHRYVALAMPSHGELTLASRTVMQLVKEIGQGMPKVERSRGASASRQSRR